MLWLLLRRSFIDGKATNKSIREKLEARLNELLQKVEGVQDALLSAVRTLSSDEQAALSNLLRSGVSPSVTIGENHQRMAVHQRIAHLENTWFSGQYKEDDCTKALCENLWVLQPELVASEHIFFKRHLSTIAQSYFPNDHYASGAWKFIQEGREADAAGVFYRANRVSDDQPTGERIFVVIESKNPGREVNQFVMDEALQYAVNLRKLAKTLAGWDIECIALGQSVGPDVRTQLYRFGSTPHTLTVVPMTWRSLIERAKQLDPASVVIGRTRINSAAPSYLEQHQEATASSSVEGDQIYEEVL